MAGLSGKIALITGGTSGMEAATAKLFQEEAATVIVTGSSDQSVATAKKNLPSVQAIRYSADSRITTGTERRVDGGITLG